VTATRTSAGSRRSCGKSSNQRRAPAGEGRPLSAVGLVLLSVASIQTGAAIAISLFDRVGFAGAVFLRNLLAIPFAFAIGRPRLRERPPQELRLALAFGVSLGVMNLAIYGAIDHLPLGVAITIEFLGPLGVAVFTGRGRLALVWAAMAALGVLALAGPFGGSADLLGVVFALVAAAGWAAYILIAGRLGRVFPGASGLAAGVMVAAVIQAPAGIAVGGTELLAPGVLGVAVAVALLSTVLPYGAEIEALRRIPPAPFGVLMSLEPAVAGLVGFIGLGQDLSAAEIAGIALVVAASIGAIRTAPKAPPLID
jgi:inner membrane transporter RhtA